MVQFNGDLLYMHLSSGIEKNHGKNDDYRSPGPDLNPWTSEQNRSAKHSTAMFSYLQHAALP
jgi:hypothetical protein